MFYVILSIVSLVCVILAAVCGYLFATIKGRKSELVATVAPVHVPEPEPVFAPREDTHTEPEAPKAETPKEPKKVSRSRSSVVVPAEAPAKPNRSDYPDAASYKKAYDSWWRLCKKVAKGGNVATTETKPEQKPETTTKPEPKAAPKASEPKAPKASAPVSAELPAKPVRSDFADGASYKKAYDAWWRLCRRIEKGAVVTNAPKAETKPEPVATETKPEPKKATKKTTEPKAEEVAPKAETTEAPKAPVSETKPLTNHSREDLLGAIKHFNGVNIYEANLTVKFGKTELYIREINSTTALLANGKEVKLSAVPFSKALLEKIIVACSEVVKKFEDKTGLNHSDLTPKAEVKEAPKTEPKDVQPVSDTERYAKNTAESIVRVMDNKNIKAVTFTDAISTIFTDPKSKKEVPVEIVGLRRGSKADIFVCFETQNKKLGRFELIKGYYVFNHETLKTILKQVNEGAAKKRNANATVELLDSAAA